ncbi:MAG: rhomboid family intramembrane serine protease [Promethearchaeota archaeon]
MVYEVKDDQIPFYKQYVSLAIIAICCIVMALQYLDYFFWTGTMLINFAFVPSTLIRGEPISILTMFTSMFMHGDIVHLIMNMWFFYVVADNCEKALGHIGFLLTYLASGLFATFLHTITSIIAGMVIFNAGGSALYNALPILDIPTLGASGAIFGIIGVYGIVFPKTKLAVLASPLTGSSKVSKTIDASVFVILYIIAEISYGIYGILAPFGAGNTAHFAHVGGFIIGAVVAYIYVWRKETKGKKK